jgi:hypothetical protein
MLFYMEAVDFSKKMLFVEPLVMRHKNRLGVQQE